jgi:general secretion pathway protein M
MERLSKTQRRVLALFLLLIAMAVVIRVVVVPVVATYVENRDTIAQMEDSIARYSRLSTQIDSLKSMVGVLEESDKLDAFVLAQESEPLAAAALQERVKSVVTTSGGTLTSTQVLPTETEQGFKRIIVNVRMAGSMDALQRVLHTLESDLPYLLADDVIILARGARKRRRTTGAADLLDVRFNLYGYMRAAGGPA